MTNNELERDKKELTARWQAYSNELGARIKSRRIELGITQDLVARKTGLSHAMISLIEAGKTIGRDKPSNVTLQTLTLIALALEVEVADLLPDITTAPTLKQVIDVKYAF